MMPKVSILISVRDQLALTQKCLSKLEATLDESISFEVLIANDASVDGDFVVCICEYTGENFRPPSWTYSIYI